MSIWKSPIFYLGLILIAVVVVALVAPFVVNWNGYRDNLEAYGRKLSGRDVAINGPIAVRLFPWPSLAAEDVSIGNAAGFAGPAMMNARGMMAELSLAGLFSGEIRVEAITVDHPVINIVRLADGQGNWTFNPDTEIRGSRLLDKVKLDQIKITEAVVHFTEEGLHYSETLTSVNGELSANTLEGPWRLHATANQNQTPIEIAFNSVEWKAGEPFGFGGKILTQDGSLPSFTFEGAAIDGHFNGKVRVEPVVKQDDRIGLDEHFIPLQMQADIDASFKLISLADIHIVPADLKDSSALIEGSAKITLTDGISALANLNSPRIDLDALAGTKSFKGLQTGVLMASLNNLMKAVPLKSDFSANLNVSSLAIAGEVLENVVLKVTAESNAIRVQNFSANLPGRSRLKFNGLVFPGETAAELGGTLSIESNDTRALANWMWPEGKALLAKIWTGSRGRLKAQSDVSLSSKSFGFQDLKYELDGSPGNGDLIVGIGNLPSLNFKLNAEGLDLDNYIATQAVDASTLMLIFQGREGFEKRLNFQIGKLRVNDVDAKDVAFDFGSNGKGFEIKKLSIGSIEGGQVQGQGLVLQGPDGLSGDVNISVRTGKPEGLLHLLGVVHKSAKPAWLDVLGQTDLQTVLAVRPGSVEPIVTFEATGTSGPFKISASGDVKDIAKASLYTFGISSEISSVNGDDILRLCGLTPFGQSSDAGKLTMTTTGSVQAGFKTVTKVDARAAHFTYEGAYRPHSHLPILDGIFSVQADDGNGLGMALGLPIESILKGPVQFSSPIITQDGQVRATKIIARVAGQNVTGDLTVTTEGEVGGDIEMDSVDLKSLLALGLMNLQGRPLKLDDRFASSIDVVKSVYLWIRPKLLQTGFGPHLNEVVIGLSVEESSRNLTIASAGNVDGPFKLDLSLKAIDAKFTLAGSLQLVIDLEKNLKLRSGAIPIIGKAIFASTFSGEGRSPAAVLTNLTGNGTMTLQDAKITQVSPQNFFQQLPSMKGVVVLQKVFDQLLRGPGFDVQAIAQPFTITAGLGNVQPIVVLMPDAELQVASGFDLSNGTIDTDITILPKKNIDLPPMRVSYVGEPQALTQRNDTSAISEKLGYALIAKDVAELDRVQTEQAKLVAKEEAQRIADQEKFAAYQAQRSELRLRQRELKVFAAQRAIDAANEKAFLAKILLDAAALTKTEMPKFLQQLH
jgi:AsmA family/AsmA-like C-terminal region